MQRDDSSTEELDLSQQHVIFNTAVQNSSFSCASVAASVPLPVDNIAEQSSLPLLLSDFRISALESRGQAENTEVSSAHHPICIISAHNDRANEVTGVHSVPLERTELDRKTSFTKSTPSVCNLDLQHCRGYPRATTTSSTGGTIHHHGWSPHKTIQPGPLVDAPMNAQGRRASGGSASPSASRPMSLSNESNTSGTASLQHGSSSFVLNPRQSPSTPARKKFKLDVDECEEATKTNMRQQILNIRYKDMASLKHTYTEYSSELFFLRNGGNMMDYLTWKKRATPQLVQFLQSSNLESVADEEDDDDGDRETMMNAELLYTAVGSTAPVGTPVAISTTLPPGVSTAAQQGIDPRKPGGRHGMLFGPHQPPEPQQTPSFPGGVPVVSSPIEAPLSVFTTAGSMGCHLSSSSTTVTVSAGSMSAPATATSPRASNKSGSPRIGVASQDAIVERAKHEAHVLQRIGELRKDGMWSIRRLPKVQEAGRNKAHWDYLLEEMQWLAADFAQERKWKKAGCRKIARMVMRYHQEVQQKEIRVEKEESQRTVRIARQLARIVDEFWGNIEKVVHYKQQTRLDEKRKKAMDLHLSFIVDQTEKYSAWLTEGLVNSASASKASSVTSRDEDGDFCPEHNASDDDEATIAMEEEDNNEADTQAEINALQKESEIPLEVLLNSLPAEVLERPASIDADQSSEEDDEKEDSRSEDGNDDELFDCSDAEHDDDVTIREQEDHEMNEANIESEMNDLKAEGEMSMEELMEKYAGAYDSDFELPETPSEIDDDDLEEEESEVEDHSDTTDNVEDDPGVEFLVDETSFSQDSTVSLSTVSGDDGRDKALNDIAATAQSLQPTGYTLETTKVITKVPFLLKSSLHLREYQHVGLDWLATMYDRKLNGILADEMGLGKTIQTIALIAHLACDKGIWGPHLIVVPTSVMLNWEMEFKKWAPGLKILTYYGTQKERKAKRTGWTKTNAFHVCITSYKLVIQDHVAFKRKKWKYLVLDEAQNIKNFKSQRWQTLLNFNSQRRLLLTGTPLQNSLMELWSLMHFLMPHVFASHKDFKEWFSNPLSGMIEGSQEYNENLIRRLHKVLRPFLLRRLKVDVEKQMPKKYEHVVMCRLSKRQRFLYDDFMSQTKTRETLNTGHFMSVINVLMQLRKVCNHPNLFDPRPIVSPFKCDSIVFHTASLVVHALEYNPFSDIDFFSIYPNLPALDSSLPAFVAHRVRKLETLQQYVVDIDAQPCPKATLKPIPLKSFMSTRVSQQVSVPSGVTPIRARLPLPVNATTVTQSPSTSQSHSLLTPQRNIAPVNCGHLTMPQGTQTIIIPSAINTTQPEQLPGFVANKLAQQQHLTVTSSVANPHPITLQIQHSQQGTRLMIPPGQIAQLPGLIHILQTSVGQHIITSQAGSAAIRPLQPLIQHATMTTTPLMHTGVPPSITTSRPPPLATTVVNGLASIASTPLSILSTNSSTSVANQQTNQNGQALPVRSAAHNVLHNPYSTVNSHKPVMRVPPLLSSQLDSRSLNQTTYTPPPVLDNRSESSHHTKTDHSQPDKRKNLKIATSNGLPSASSTSHKSEITRGTGPPAKKLRLDRQAAEKSPFYLSHLVQRREERRREKLALVAKLNHKHCDVRPVYGSDLCDAVTVQSEIALGSWCGGYLHCLNVHALRTSDYSAHTYWTQTTALCDIVLTPDRFCKQMQDITERFAFVTPAVVAPSIMLRTCRVSPEQRRHQLLHHLRTQLSLRADFMHPIESRMLVQFPEPRLIQYDCGKLQTLDVLLRQLKSGDHRVLIFTQMTRMLDILESFLNYHGYRYLRLDGTTKVEQRQVLMDRYNVDRRIFAMILSTRSGGVGVNLTGADTVIFYDSDWNPTMDAQAQDRCHRIGQTRDVHIYRLVSKMTIEENILKKANQKRLLGDVAIEGGNFTTAFFRKHTITDLFEEPTGLETTEKEKKNVAEEKAFERKKRATARAEASEAAGKELTDADLEQALCGAEEDADVQAAKSAAAEQNAELAEFDETIPWDEREAERRKEEQDVSKVELELAQLDKELSPIERYAVQFMEILSGPLACEELERAEEQTEHAKKEWELARIKEMKEEEEMRAELEEDEMLFTYSRDDAYNQAYVSDFGEVMPMWCPPTPPVEDSDVYIDDTMTFLYCPNSMPEHELPPVFVKKENKRLKLDTAADPNALLIAARKQKIRKEAEGPRVPRSLFDRPTAALVKMRREAKLQKVNGLIRPPLKSLPMIAKQTLLENVTCDQPEWLVHEDWALLQVVQTLLELPLNLMVVSPAQIPNWDLVADVVNAGSRLYRSPKMCKNRFEAVIVPREEGKIVYDINPKKQKKKSVYKIQSKPTRPMRTSQLFLQDNNGSITQLHNLRFDTIKALAAKREPPLRPRLAATSNQKNAKHHALLQESGINYDLPLTPIKVASIRAERIEKEKKKQEQVREQQLAAQRAAAAAQKATSVATTITTVTHLQPVVTAVTSITSMAGAMAIQKPTLAGGITTINLPRGPAGTSSIVVNAPGAVTGETFATINKRISQTVAPAATAITGTSLTGQRVRTATAGTVTTMTVQEITNQAEAQAQARTAFQVAAATPTVITTTTNAAKLAAKRFTSAATVQQLTQTKTLNQAQYNLIRNVQATQWQQHQLRAQKLTAEQLKQQQQTLKRLQTAQVTLGGHTMATKTLTGAITPPILATIPQVTAAQRLVAAQQQQQQPQQKTIKRPMTDQDVQLLLKHQAFQAQQKAHAAATASSVSVSAVCVSGGVSSVAGATTSLPSSSIQQIHVTQPNQLPAQIITQQVAGSVGGQQQILSQQVAGVSSGGQPIATIVKTVTAASSCTTMTIPANTVNINVSLPQQKGKLGAPVHPGPHQIRHLHFQNLQQQRKQLPQQKIATLTPAQVQQVTAKTGSLQIIQQPQKTLPATVTMQQFHQLIKQPTIQQIFTSMAPASTTSATVIVTQAPPSVQNIAKLSVPATSLRNITHVSLASSLTTTSATSGHLHNPAHIKLAEQIFLNQKSSVTPNTASPVITITAPPPSSTSSSSSSEAAILTSSSPSLVSLQSIPHAQANVTISPLSAPSSTTSAISQQQQAMDNATTVLIQQSPCQSPSQSGDSLLVTSQKTPYTMRLRNPPKQ